MTRKSSLPAVAVCAVAVALGAAVVLHNNRPVQAARPDAPSYASNGDMLPPSNYREWIYLSTGIDMSYSPNATQADHSTFDNVFVDPAAYRSFLATGAWPDKTTMVLELRGAKKKGSINQHGQFQDTAVMGIEVHVKDEKRFAGKWAFFEFDSMQKTGTLVPEKAACYTCHAAHGAVDTTFVQFYPTLLPLAKEKKTLSANYLKDEEAAVGK
jgi:hypothetical protein